VSGTALRLVGSTSFAFPDGTEILIYGVESGGAEVLLGTTETTLGSTGPVMVPGGEFSFTTVVPDGNYTSYVLVGEESESLLERNPTRLSNSILPVIALQ
jgi:hypothetical protein